MANVATTQKVGQILVGLVLLIVTAACADDTTATDQNPSTTTPSTDTTSTTSTSTTTTLQTQAPQTTAPPSTTTTLAEPALIAWEDLENLSFELDGNTIVLEDGQATISYGGASETMFLLQNRVTQGDLDHDGDDDLAAHIIKRSAGTGVFHLIVPVINNDGTPEPQTPVHVGDRVIIEEIAIEYSLIEVTLLDRQHDEALRRHHPTQNPRNRLDRGGTSSSSDQHQTAQEPPVARTGPARHHHPI